MNAERWVLVALVVSAAASIGLLVVYVLGGSPPVEGILLALAFGGLGVASVIWAAALVHAPLETEPLEPPVVPEASGAPVTRRTFLVRAAIGAVAALGAALAIPALSLGPRPGRTLFRTAWTPRARLVDGDGRPVAAADVSEGSVQTVFPEGAVGSADAQTLLIRVNPSDLALPPGREGWTPDGCVAYSKLCTHAGCPVGLYRDADHALLCPCHQSTFDVLRGAVPTFGPATRPLPQLALAVDGEGYLVAQRDFAEPVGPSFWNMTHNDDEAE
jgi:ubiquinol-cytochrome c reductase iron-sulfur subunit